MIFSGMYQLEKWDHSHKKYYSMAICDIKVHDILQKRVNFQKNKSSHTAVRQYQYRKDNHLHYDPISCLHTIPQTKIL